MAQLNEHYDTDRQKRKSKLTNVNRQILIAQKY